MVDTFNIAPVKEQGLPNLHSNITGDLGKITLSWYNALDRLLNRVKALEAENALLKSRLTALEDA